jgi:hypothetical protein
VRCPEDSFRTDARGRREGVTAETGRSTARNLSNLADKTLCRDPAPKPVPDDGTARIGRFLNGASFLPPEPEPVPAVIARRQLVITLAAAGFVAAEETPSASGTVVNFVCGWS